MGGTCSSYCSQQEHNDTELNNDGTAKTIEKQSATQGTSKEGSTAQGQSNAKAQNNKIDAQDNVSMIIRVQALIRGYLQRRRYRIVKFTYDQATKYFKSEEGRETLDGFFTHDSKIQTREYTYKTGAVYNGQWKGGLRHGTGTMVWTDNARYEGQWEYNQASGMGKFFHVDGDIYEGSWLNNKANGLGVYTNIKGARYEGGWKEDQQHGQGLETWPEGSKYEGAYVLSKKEGHGKYTWADGSIYEGQWQDNKINGYGVYLWSDGRQYYGSWSNNDMQGYGIYIYSDGVRYDGEYMSDKKEGFGIYYWTDGRKYDGWWHKGKQHGVGTYVDTQKQTQKFGLWEHGKRLKWFDEDEVQSINNGNFSVVQHFTDPDKSAIGLRSGATFKKPVQFDDQMAVVKRVLNIKFK